MTSARQDTIPLPGALVPGDAPIGAPPQRGDLTPDLIASDWWTDRLVAGAGIPILDIPFVSVGGGIGSFVTVDYLRICGVPTEAIRVLTQLRHPWESYEYLTRVSQIPRGERLRSDAASCPDNIWGFPSYAVREALSARSLREVVEPLFQIAVEPIFTDYYTPKAGQAFESMEKEYHRISYPQTVRQGQVRMVRRRVGGGYFTILTPPQGASATKRVAFRSRFVHLAVGYPGLKFLPDLMQYREQHRDFGSVVAAYEPHEQVYERLRAAAGTVVVRGGGIVASRVLQRLIDDRDRFGLPTRILHVFRTFVGQSHGPHLWMRRRGGDGWAYQGFNYPKSVWGGQDTMLPTLNGRIQTRIFVSLVVGGTWTLLITPLLPIPGTSTDAYATTVTILLTVTVLGIGWELLYHLLQQFRWEKDWPTFFGLITVVNEGALVWLLLERRAVPGIDAPVPLSAFLIQFGTTWVVVWLTVNGPMRVPFVHWRFRGGRLI